MNKFVAIASAVGVAAAQSGPSTNARFLQATDEYTGPQTKGVARPHPTEEQIMAAYERGDITEADIQAHMGISAGPASVAAAPTTRDVARPSPTTRDVARPQPTEEQIMAAYERGDITEADIQAHMGISAGPASIAAAPTTRDVARPSPTTRDVARPHPTEEQIMAAYERGDITEADIQAHMGISAGPASIAAAPTTRDVARPSPTTRDVARPAVAPQETVAVASPTGVSFVAKKAVVPANTSEYTGPKTKDVARPSEPSTREAVARPSEPSTREAVAPPMGQPQVSSYAATSSLRGSSEVYDPSEFDYASASAEEVYLHHVEAGYIEPAGGASEERLAYHSDRLQNGGIPVDEFGGDVEHVALTR